MCTAALYVIAPNWKKSLSVGELINKLCHIHPMEYYSAIKNELLIFKITVMNLRKLYWVIEARQ